MNLTEYHDARILTLEKMVNKQALLLSEQSRNIESLIRACELLNKASIIDGKLLEILKKRLDNLENPPTI